MKSPNPVNLPGLEDKTFILLVIAVSLAFAWILWPFFGAVLWGTILAIVFAPRPAAAGNYGAETHLCGARHRASIVLLIVILPLILIGGLLLQEAFAVYEKFQSGELNFGRYFQQVLGVLPAWVNDLVERFGLTNLGAMQEKLSGGLVRGQPVRRRQGF